MSLRCHIVKAVLADGRVQSLCGRTGFPRPPYLLGNGETRGNDFTFQSPSGLTLFQAITLDRPEPKPAIDCRACLQRAADLSETRQRRT